MRTSFPRFLRPCCEPRGFAAFARSAIRLFPLQAMPARQFKGKPDLWKRYGQVRMLHTFSGPFHQRTKRAGLLTPDGVIGVIETGSAAGPDGSSGYSSLLRQTLANLPEGTWELVCHPGYNDADLRGAGTRLLESREEERRLLTSPELRRFLEKQRSRSSVTGNSQVRRKSADKFAETRLPLHEDGQVEKRYFADHVAWLTL